MTTVEMTKDVTAADFEAVAKTAREMGRREGADEGASEAIKIVMQVMNSLAKDDVPCSYAKDVVTIVLAERYGNRHF